MEVKKTHTEVNEPQISVQGLADYMAGSERAKRSVVQSCRYRAKVRLVQYNEGKLVCAQYLRKGDEDVEALKARSEDIRNKLADDDFDVSVNQLNADLVARFASVEGQVVLPNAEVEKGMDFKSITVNGVKVSMRANLRFRRKTKTNKLKTGTLMFRFAKGKPLAETVGSFQAAAIFGFLRSIESDDNAEPERDLCRVLDLYTGNMFSAPGNSVNIWHDMKAACATIAERWPNIPPPPGAVL